MKEENVSSYNILVLDRNDLIMYLAIVKGMNREMITKSLELHPEILDYGAWNEYTYYADVLDVDKVLKGMRTDPNITVTVLDEDTAINRKIISEDSEPRCVDELWENLS